jgi:hypothetical protein
MKEYKTLHRIRLRFFWPKLRTDIQTWVRQCAHCILTNSAIRRHSELLFSWPVSCPFHILHVDLWKPGDTTSFNDGSTYVLAAMCDLTGMVIAECLSDITSANLAHVFMQQFLLKIGLTDTVVVDAGSTFRGLFESMCEQLKLKLHAAARGNHKAVSVERFFRVLNRSVAIACNDRGTNQVFVEAVHCTAYAWNASPIDGTDIIRSVAAVGREFKFPLDLSLSIEPPTFVDGSVSAVHDFLRLAQSHSRFSTEILAILTEERRTYHRERANESRDQSLFSVDDLVMVRVQVQSKASINRVAKLSYRLRGPYVVTQAIGHGAYLLRKWDSPTSPELKYHAEHISLLPPAIRPAEPLDGPDLRYLNSSHAPIPHPLKDSLDIELYNSVWFSNPPDTRPPDFSTVPAPLVDDPLSQSPPSPPPVDFPDSASTPTISCTDPLPPAPLPPGNAFHCSLLSSCDRLFFISYCPPGTFRPRWYLVTVDLAQTDSDPRCTDHLVTGLYYCHFLFRHPSDKAFADHSARWWPEWHEYTTAADGIIDFGSRVLFPPNRSPNPLKYIAWADTVPLTHPDVFISGPFDFATPSSNPPGRTPSFRQYIPVAQWSSLAESCLLRGIIPPQLIDPTPIPAPPKRKR